MLLPIQMPRSRRMRGGDGDFIESVVLFGLGAAVAAPQSPIGSFFVNLFTFLAYLIGGIVIVVLVVILYQIVVHKQKFTLQNVPEGTPGIGEEKWEQTPAGNDVAVYA